MSFWEKKPSGHDKGPHVHYPFGCLALPMLFCGIAMAFKRLWKATLALAGWRLDLNIGCISQPTAAKCGVFYLYVICVFICVSLDIAYLSFDTHFISFRLFSFHGILFAFVF